ncbi:two-component regulator propeller domain-containing protein [Roseivirga sp. BDSF3-8]|uniref:sensor histidine kinase n=1 Tax=Roseivirga sp. BDSF3-8 TaxID=3241598 RepID=UPI003531C8A6
MKYFLQTCIAMMAISLPLLVQGQAYDFAQYSIDKGLSQSQVKGMAQDASGRMWFGTTGGGLCRFDGQKMEVLRREEGLPNNSLEHLAFDSLTRTMYVSAENGLISRYDGDRFTEIPVADSTPAPKILTGMCLDKAGVLYAAYLKGGMYKLTADGRHMKQVAGTPDSLTTVRLSGEGYLLMSRRDGNVYRLENDRFSLVARVPGGHYVADIIAHEGGMYLGTNGGVYRYSEEQWQYLGLRERITSVHVSPAGELWAGTMAGLWRYSTGAWEHINKKSGLTDLPVTCFFNDREGNLWIATDGAGVFLFRGERFTHFGEAQGLSHEVVMALAQGPESLWIGTSRGLFTFDGEQIRPKEDLPLEGVYISTLLPDTTGGMWVLSRGGGLIHYGRGGIRFYNKDNGLQDNYLTIGRLDEEGRLWIGSGEGLIRQGEDGFDLLQPEGEPLRVVWGLMPYKDGVLVGFGGGLRYFDGETFHRVPGAELMEGKAVLGIFKGPGDRLYCNVYNAGLYVLNPDKAEGFYLTTSSGLTSNLIYSVIAADQYLYLGTERGVDRLTFTSGGLLSDVRNYGRSEGFKGVEANRNAVMEDSLGRIWFGNVRGVALYDPAKDRPDMPEPALALNAVRLFYEVPDWAEFADSVDSWHNVPVGPVFSYDQNHLVFDFGGSTFLAPERLRYRYRLEGLEEVWSPPVERGQAMYANLPPGEYTLHVEAMDEGAGRLGKALAYSFVIEPPIWGRWWFMLLMVLAALLIIKLISDNRVRVKLEKALLVEKVKATEMTRLRKELARDFHDEIGNHFASISVLVQMLSARFTDNKEAAGIIGKLEQLSRSLYLGGRDFIWSIEPESERVNEMILYIKDFGEELFENSPIEFRSDIPENGELDNVKLPAGANRQVIMIAKEAMTNAMKHSGAAVVTMGVRYEGKEVTMEIKDNGCGLMYNSKGHVRGLENMKKRAERVGGKLSYLSQDKEGLSVIVVLPVNTI